MRALVGAHARVGEQMYELSMFRTGNATMDAPLLEHMRFKVAEFEKEHGVKATWFESQVPEDESA